MRRLRSSPVLLGAPCALALTVACNPTSSNTPPPGEPSCAAGYTGSVVVACPDASIPDANANIPPIPGGDAGEHPGDATVTVTDAEVFEAGPAPPLPLCTGTFGLDATFGTAGMLFDPMVNGGEPSSLAVQPDGKYIVGSDAILARYNADGTIDMGFGQSGYLRYPEETYPSSFMIQPNGDIVLSGTGADDGQGDTCLLARLTPSGNLDTSFGTGGASGCTPTPTIGTDFSQVVQRPDGRFVASGSAYHGTLPPLRDYALFQFDSNGIQDKTFGTSGEATAGFPTDAPVDALALQPDGKAVVAGQVTVDRGDMPADLGVARFNVDGSLDTTFGTGGRVDLTLAQADVGPTSIAFQSNGSIVIAVVGGGNNTFNVLRLTPTGQLDTTFGTNGIASEGFFGLGDAAVGMSLFADDSILLGGNVSVATDAGYSLTQYGFVRFLSTGALDTSFGTGGKFLTTFPGQDEGVTFLGQVLQSNGALMTVGAGNTLDDAGDSVNQQLLLARYSCQ